MHVAGIIPARYQSARLPGKPLRLIGGKPMIQRVYERASRAVSLAEVYVATDDERIMAAVRDFNGRAVMTPASLESGTDRAAFAAEHLDADIIVNIQGDEPFIEPASIDMAVEVLAGADDAHMGTLVSSITDADLLASPHAVKVVLDSQRYALYFSRSPIPFCRDADGYRIWLERASYYQHIGIYSYRKDFLMEFSRTPSSSLERAEKLEQLRALEAGARIKVGITEARSFGVDTPEDLEKANEYFSRRNKRDR